MSNSRAREGLPTAAQRLPADRHGSSRVDPADFPIDPVVIGSSPPRVANARRTNAEPPSVGADSQLEAQYDTNATTAAVLKVLTNMAGRFPLSFCPNVDAVLCGHTIAN